jgi:hypothetical protein
MKPGGRMKLPKAVAKIYAAVEELEEEFKQPFTVSPRQRRRVQGSRCSGLPIEPFSDARSLEHLSNRLSIYPQ